MTENTDNITAFSLPAPPKTAAEWFAINGSEEAAAGHRAAFEQWLSIDDNRGAYRRLEQIWAEMEALSDSPVITATRRPVAKRRVNSWWLGGLAAACLTGLIASGVLINASRDEGRYYNTAVGEQTQITLRDGSVVTLNTQSTIYVDFSGPQRRIELRAGEAFFKVAHDASRPFIVQAGDTAVRALGTEFDVYRHGDKAVSVAVASGKVQVRHIDEAQSRIVKLLSGQSIIVAPMKPLVVRSTQISKELSWQKGILEFSSTPLADAVAEINRYSATRIVLSDARLADMKVNGVFNIRDVDRFIPTIQKILPVTTEQLSDTAIVLHYRQADNSPQSTL